jgi:signal transduction histidine kinase
VFIERPRRVLSREQLLDAARGRSIEAFDRSIDLLVSRLRQKLGDDPKSPALIIRVIDHGPGIAADKREAVFEPFYRLEGSRNRNSGGVGLGMTIAREAAERLGGALSLEDTPGGGLTAVIRLPRIPS